MFRNPWLFNGILISIGTAAIATGLLSDYMGVRPIMLGTSWLIILGGLTFGVGVGLAGTCASGMLFRIPEGYVTHLLELVGFSAGILLWAEFLQVPLSHFYSAPISVYSLIGVRADVYSFVTGGAFLLVGIYLNKFVPKKKKESKESETSWTLDPRRAWDPRLAGLILAGIVVVMFAVTPKSLLGVTAPYASFGAWTLSIIWRQHEKCSLDGIVSWDLSTCRSSNCRLRGSGIWCGSGKEFQSSRPEEQATPRSGYIWRYPGGTGSGSRGWL